MIKYHYNYFNYYMMDYWYMILKRDGIVKIYNCKWFESILIDKCFHAPYVLCVFVFCVINKNNISTPMYTPNW